MTTFVPPPDSPDRETYVREAARRAFRFGELPRLAALPELFAEPCPRSIYVSPEIADGREVHAIGVYEGRRTGDRKEPGERHPEPVRVRVRKTSHPVVLFLMSYNPVRWELSVDPDASLHGVALSSYYESTVSCDVPVAFVVPLQNGPYEFTLESTEPGDLRGARMIAKLQDAIKAPLASFQGDYYGEQFQVPCWNDESAVRAVLAAYPQLVRARTRSVPGPFLLVDGGFISRYGTRDEPIAVPADDTKAVTFCDADGRYYAITNHDLYAVEQDGSAHKVVPPEGEHLSWLGGVTYDSKRRRVVVTTRWHAGVHCFYDPVAASWKTVPIEEAGGGIHALAYDATRDEIVGLVGGLLGPPLLGVLSPDLQPLRRLPCSERLPLPEVLVKGPSVQMAAFPNAVFLSLEENSGAFKSPFHPDRPTRVERGLLVALDRDDMQLVELVPGSATRVVDPPEDGPVEGESAPRVEFVDDDDTWVYTADLQREGARIVTQVERTGKPVLVIHRSHWSAMLVAYSLYHGQLASLDETSYPDWQERLARAKHELGERMFVARNDKIVAPDLRSFFRNARCLWTRQAAEDLGHLGRDGRDLLLRMGTPSLRGSGVPMDGPYHGFHAHQIPISTRLVVQLVGDEMRVAYLRHGVNPTWGRLVKDSGPTD